MFKNNVRKFNRILASLLIMLFAGVTCAETIRVTADDTSNNPNGNRDQTSATMGAMGSASSNTANTVDDATITAGVKGKLGTESVLVNTPINVSTNNGIVKLSGTLDSNAQADRAAELAQSIPGVKDVDTSQLMVNGSAQPMTDSLITAKVKGMFIQQKLFGDKDVAAMSISVETNNGVVTLSGTANDQTQINNAIKIARSVSGVKEVKSIVSLPNS